MSRTYFWKWSIKYDNATFNKTNIKTVAFYHIVQKFIKKVALELRLGLLAPSPMAPSPTL